MGVTNWSTDFMACLPKERENEWTTDLLLNAEKTSLCFGACPRQTYIHTNKYIRYVLKRALAASRPSKLIFFCTTHHEGAGEVSRNYPQSDLLLPSPPLSKIIFRLKMLWEHVRVRCSSRVAMCSWALLKKFELQAEKPIKALKPIWLSCGVL